MWHDLLAAVPLLTEPTAPTADQSHDVLIAVIGVAGPLLLGLLTLYVTARSRRTEAVPAPPPVPLNSHETDEDDIELATQRARIRVLETFLWRQHVNPNKITTGDEAMDSVVFE